MMSSGKSGRRSSRPSAAAASASESQADRAASDRAAPAGSRRARGLAVSRRGAARRASASAVRDRWPRAAAAAARVHPAAGRHVSHRHAGALAGWPAVSRSSPPTRPAAASCGFGRSRRGPSPQRDRRHRRCERSVLVAGWHARRVFRRRRAEARRRPAAAPSPTICESGNGAGGTWNRDDVIVFSPLDGPLMRVAASGGRPEPLTAFDRERARRIISIRRSCPDGQHYVFYVASRERGLYVGAARHRPTRSACSIPIRRCRQARRATPGIYDGDRPPALRARSRADGAPLRSRRACAVSGEPTTVVANGGLRSARPGRVHRSPTACSSIARSSIVRWPSSRGSIAAGKRAGDDRRAARHVSHDHAVARRTHDRDRSARCAGSAVGLARRRRSAAPARVSPSTYWSGDPLWSPDGQQLAYSIADDTPPNLAIRDERRPRPRTPPHAPAEPSSSTRTAGRRTAATLVYEALSERHRLGSASWCRRPTSDAAPQRLLQTRANETTGPRVAGRPLAGLYVRTSPASSEVYVAPFPELQGTRAVSAGGGSRPFWRRDGRELFYLGRRWPLMAVPIGAGVRCRRRQRRPSSSAPRSTAASIVPDPGGQRFLIARPAPCAGDRSARNRPQSAALDARPGPLSADGHLTVRPLAPSKAMVWIRII